MATKLEIALKNYKYNRSWKRKKPTTRMFKYMTTSMRQHRATSEWTKNYHGVNHSFGRGMNPSVALTKRTNYIEIKEVDNGSEGLSDG